VCVGTGTGTTWPTDPTCAANSWTDSASFTGAWASVTGLRVQFDFTTVTAGTMAPGGSVTVRFQTVNAPATASAPDLASVDAPVTGEFAWNQFGAQAVLTNGTTLRRAPVKAGVTLASGPMEVRKVVSGAAAEYAADTFTADVACVVAGEPVQLGADATVELDAGNGYVARIDGIPLGADCTITETGEVGEFGETRRTADNTQFAVLQTATGEVPTGQVATLGNVYDFGSLAVTKSVDTLATVGDFGPFAFELSCVSALGQDIELAAADRSFAIAAGETHAVTADTIPMGAVCELTESDTDAATSVRFAGDGVEDLGDGSATVVIGSETLVEATNHYAAGTLSVLKTVTGDGAPAYGDGPFAAAVSCTYGGAVVYTEPLLPIQPDVATLVPETFPAGTVCEVSEVLTGGATDVSNPPAVVITGPGDGEEVGAVTALLTNDFRTGGLSIRKERTGDGVEEFGAGPFQAQVTCTWLKDGDVITVPLADGGVVTLSADNGYLAVLEGILVGATCAVVETDAGLATGTTLTPADGTVTVRDPLVTEELAEVVITNRFDVGQLELSKVADRTAVQIGDVVRYSITVRNTGQIDAADLTVTDLLPDHATIVSAVPTAREGDGTVEWHIAQLRAGESVTVTVDVRYDTAGSTVNRATVTNPDGPWRPVVSPQDACDGDEAACAAVLVTVPLAATGGAGWAVPATLAGLLLTLGAALLIWRRRTARA
jgi:uncharacterized repeat protein (TIGR01451 family)